MIVPKKWCIKGCVELEEWGRKKENSGVNCAFSFPYYYYTFDPNLLIWSYSEQGLKVKNYTEITFEQFQQYILKEKSQDYSYLIPIIKKLNKHVSRR